MQEQQQPQSRDFDLTPNFTAILNVMLQSFESAMQGVIRLSHPDDINTAVEPLVYLNIALNSCTSAADIERVKDALQRQLTAAQERRRQVNELFEN